MAVSDLVLPEKGLMESISFLEKKHQDTEAETVDQMAYAVESRISSRLTVHDNPSYPDFSQISHSKLFFGSLTCATRFGS